MMLLEILSWLPAKAIHKLKSSSKLFLELPQTPYFIAKQAVNSLKKDRPSCFFIQRDNNLNHNDHVELHPLSGEKLSSGVPENMLGFIARSRLKILSSSNGLLLCLHRTELFIINPTTCYLLHIPLPNYLQQGGNLHSVSMTLECDSDDYSYLTEDSTYFRPYIMSYEITNGDDEDKIVETKFLRVPKEARRGCHDDSCHVNILKWGEVAGYQAICLVRLRKRVFMVWILTNYESSSWRRIMKVRVKGMSLVE
ncbi:hypothetical protein Ahy_B06g084402 [Arachis hypogaea]|uniref:F-box associated domain-containing protein n=1 Tax=Arachis hypogaea TaxID=3818 RepID=A0A444YRS5_ARAHY|nr:hypothetical protein Ahy_B06g084402 [Arachis hypogaea]